jgi:hypothetical protein
LDYIGWFPVYNPTTNSNSFVDVFLSGGLKDIVKVFVDIKKCNLFLFTRI